MSRNILIITQRIDENDDLLGFFVDWVQKFAKNFDKVFVITLAEGKHKLLDKRVQDQDEVKILSLGKERGAWKITQFFRFYYYLLKFVPRSDGIFAHMSPIFVIASWPVAFIFRKRIILWYLHRSIKTKFDCERFKGLKVLEIRAHDRSPNDLDGKIKTSVFKNFGSSYECLIIFYF